jgi:hypothetical protein
MSIWGYADEEPDHMHSGHWVELRGVAGGSS